MKSVKKDLDMNIHSLRFLDQKMHLKQSLLVSMRMNLKPLMTLKPIKMRPIITITTIVEEEDGDIIAEVEHRDKILNGDKLLINGLTWQKSTLQVWKEKNKKLMPIPMHGNSAKKDPNGLKSEPSFSANLLMLLKESLAKSY